MKLNTGHRMGGGQFTLSKEEAQEIFQILMEECGAMDYWRDNFVFHNSEGNETVEYRFQGKLGFGGKFWNTNNKLYVNCYREDETPERLAMIEKANVRLAHYHLERLTS